MKKFLKIFFLIAIIFQQFNCVEVSYARREAIQGISKEDLQKMTIDQNIQFLEKTDSYFEVAVRKLAEIGENSVDPLLEHLRDNRDNKQIVTATIYTLGRIGPKSARAIPTINNFVRSDEIDIRNAAISALGRIGRKSERSIPLIKDALTDENEFTRTLAYRALIGIGTPQAKSIAKEYQKRLEIANKIKAKQGKSD
ncbi:MAG: HEAT repeat domain-containing protein [Rickettsiales bacterium]|nr:HEAT repeat domain-containing protein [Rickettsiales bacterium]